MDQVHEELKHPVVGGSSAGACPPSCPSDDHSGSSSDGQEAEEDQNMMDVRMKSSDASLSSDLSTTDTEYETCDSGLSSERGSVEQDQSSGEEDMAGDQNDEAGSNKYRSWRKDKHKISPEDSNSIKMAKETANIKQKAQEGDCGDFCDSVSEMDPLQGESKKQRGGDGQVILTKSHRSSRSRPTSECDTNRPLETNSGGRLHEWHG